MKDQLGDNLKLFVWEREGVLPNNQKELMFALARDFAHARKLMNDKYPETMCNWTNLRDYRIINDPEAFKCTIAFSFDELVKVKEEGLTIKGK